MFLKKINRADVLSILQKEDALIKTLEANGGGYRFDNETSSRTFYGASKEDLFTFERNTDFDKTLSDNALNIPYADTKKGNWLGGIDILNARAKIIKSLNSMSSIRLKTDEDINNAVVKITDVINSAGLVISNGFLESDGFKELLASPFFPKNLSSFGDRPGDLIVASMDALGLVALPKDSVGLVAKKDPGKNVNSMGDVKDITPIMSYLTDRMVSEKTGAVLPFRDVLLRFAYGLSGKSISISAAEAGNEDIYHPGVGDLTPVIVEKIRNAYLLKSKGQTVDIARVYEGVSLRQMPLESVYGIDNPSLQDYVNIGLSKASSRLMAVSKFKPIPADHAEQVNALLKRGDNDIFESMFVANTLNELASKGVSSAKDDFNYVGEVLASHNKNIKNMAQSRDQILALYNQYNAQMEKAQPIIDGLKDVLPEFHNSMLQKLSNLNPDSFLASESHIVLLGADLSSLAKKMPEMLHAAIKKKMKDIKAVSSVPMREMKKEYAHLQDVINATTAFNSAKITDDMSVDEKWDVAGNSYAVLAGHINFIAQTLPSYDAFKEKMKAEQEAVKVAPEAKKVEKTDNAPKAEKEEKPPSPSSAVPQKNEKTETVTSENTISTPVEKSDVDVPLIPDPADAKILERADVKNIIDGSKQTQLESDPYGEDNLEEYVVDVAKKPAEKHQKGTGDAAIGMLDGAINGRPESMEGEIQPETQGEIISYVMIGDKNAEDIPSRDLLLTEINRLQDITYETTLSFEDDMVVDPSHWVTKLWQNISGERPFTDMSDDELSNTIKVAQKEFEPVLKSTHKKKIKDWVLKSGETVAMTKEINETLEDYPDIMQKVKNIAFARVLDHETGRVSLHATETDMDDAMRFINGIDEGEIDLVASLEMHSKHIELHNKVKELINDNPASESTIKAHWEKHFPQKGGMLGSVEEVEAGIQDFTAILEDKTTLSIMLDSDTSPIKDSFDNFPSVDGDNAHIAPREPEKKEYVAPKSTQRGYDDFDLDDEPSHSAIGHP